MRRLPGRLLLKVARIVFDEAVRADVVVPTIADLQQEVRDAPDSTGRLRARMRGYAAFWTLVLAAPIAFHRWPTRSIGEDGVRDRYPVIFFALTAAILALCGWRLLGWSTLVIAAGSVIFAMAIHRWHVRHPTELVLPEKGSRIPEINQSRIPVDANIGGLAYVIGSLVVVLIGLPFARWFFLAAALLGALCAWALAAWHLAHPRQKWSLIGPT